MPIRLVSRYRAAGAGAVLLIASLALAQNPQQYPYPQQGPYPQQYPYPPNGPYPQDQRYPARLPGGVPIGIPMPEVKFPKRKPKEGGDKAPATPGALKISIAAVDGTLRKFGAKDLVLETPKSRLLRFRLLAKTQFRDKADQPIRDSLLQAGDRLTLHVNSDDPETALRVILDRAGTSAERAAAGKPFDEAKVTEPEAGDLTVKPVPAIVEEPGSVPAVSTTAEPGPDPGAPTIRRTPQGIPQGVTADAIIDAARQAASAFNDDLPNFLVNQVTTRYMSSTIPASWRAVDVVEVDVSSQGGREEYKNVRINGRPTNRPMEETEGGAWSTGEFVTTLQDILSPATAAAFARRSDTMLGTRAAYHYDLSVEQHNSHWRIVAPDKSRSFQPAYTGGLWIDKETKRVLRIEMKARDFPSGFPWNRVTSTLEYGYVLIDGRSYLLPTESENSGCMAGTNDCSRNILSFRNYRKFSADAKIVFDKLVSTRD